jgi:hypothetical protein
LSLWNKIFGHQQERLSSPITSGSFHLSYIKYLDLLNSIAGIGTDTLPLLRKGYDPVSSMPCTDFSPWISVQFLERDFIALWFFVNQYYEQKAPDSSIPKDCKIEEVLIRSYSRTLGTNHNNAAQELRSQSQRNEMELEGESLWLEVTFNKFLQKDFKKYLHIDEKAILDIQSFFVISAGISSQHRPFWIAEGKEADTLTKVLSVYPFSIDITHFSELIKTANAFLKSMKKEEGTDYWSQWPYYKISTIQEKYELKLATDLLAKLQALGVGERLHFFDFASSLPGLYWAGHSSFKTRRVGVVEKDSLEKMINLGLFAPTSDVECIPDIISKTELKELATEANFDLRKSWDLKKTYSFLSSTDDGRSFLRNLVLDRKAVKLNEIYKDDIDSILSYQVLIKPIADLLAMI